MKHPGDKVTSSEGDMYCIVITPIEDIISVETGTESLAPCIWCHVNCNFRFHSIAIFDYIHESMRRGVPGKGSPSPLCQRLWQLTLLGAGTPLPWRPSPGWGASWQETLARRRSSVSAIWGKDWPFFWWGKMWLCVLGLPPSPRWWSLISNYIQRFQTQTLCVNSLSNSRNIYSIMWWNVYFNCNAGFLICIHLQSVC